MGNLLGISCCNQKSCTCGANQEKVRAVAVNVSPKTIHFSLSNDTSSTSTFLTLGHPGDTTDYVAFKIKVNQPRRYLVRPSHGLIAPGSSVSIMITIVKKEQDLIRETHELLDYAMPPTWSNHKFLIQSCSIPQEHLPRTFHDSGMDDLINWKRVWSGDFSSVSYNTLAVEHVVVGKKKPSSRQMVKDMTPNELASELQGLRDMFDKLKDMHIALLTERDLLHNKIAAANPPPVVASPAPQTNKQDKAEKSSASTREVL